jgi:phage tail-like protein
VPDDLIRAFRFQVTLTLSAGTGSDDDPDRLGDGAFQECNGLDLEVDVQEHLEGGRNDGIVRQAGRVKLQPLVLKRGMLAGDAGTRDELWRWIQDIVAGVRPLRRYDGLVEVLARGSVRSSSPARSSTRAPARSPSRSCTSRTRA